MFFLLFFFLRFFVETKYVGFKNLPSSDSQNSKGGSDIGMVEATGWMFFFQGGIRGGYLETKGTPTGDS